MDNFFDYKETRIEKFYGFFRYTIPRHINDARWEIVYAFKRLFFGLDDRMYFNYNYENAKQTLKVLRWMKEHKHGSPYTTDPDNVLTTPDTPTDFTGVNDDWHKRWDEALGLMIDGFQAYLDADEVHIRDANGKYDVEASRIERDRLWAIWEKGSKLYIANYGGLWD